MSRKESSQPTVILGFAVDRTLVKPLTLGICVLNIFPTVISKWFRMETVVPTATTLMENQDMTQIIPFDIGNPRWVCSLTWAIKKPG